MQVSSALPLSPQIPTDREKLHKAAQAFEAIFVRQMLSSARAASFGDGIFSSKGTETFQQMQDERFAEIASQSGALGFAKVIEAQLASRIGAGVAPGPSTGSGRAEVGMAPSTNPAQPEPVEGSWRQSVQER